MYLSKMKKKSSDTFCEIEKSSSNFYKCTIYGLKKDESLHIGDKIKQYKNFKKALLVL